MWCRIGVYVGSGSERGGEMSGRKLGGKVFVD